jgi:glycosyltransferase involved in cell wall biosynthesis
MISIIIPLFNEGENILLYNTDLFPVIDAISKKFEEDVEYIFVDDGSSDDTATLLSNVRQGRNDVVFIRHPVNRGMGAALKSGFSQSRGDVIITMDADLTFRPSDVEKLLLAFREGRPDCVSGSPYLEKDLMEEVTPFRLLLSKSVNFLYKIILASDISCVSPIFRLYRRDTLLTMNISSNNFEINAEIISKMIIQGKKIVEVAVPLYKRRHGSSKINVRKEIANYLKLLYKIARTKYLHKEWM